MSLCVSLCVWQEKAKSSGTSKTQFKLPGDGKNLKVEAKWLSGNKASYTWLVGKQAEKALQGHTLIYRCIADKSALISWLRGWGVPSCQDGGVQLLSYNQDGDSPIAINHFIDALTFSFSDPWGTLHVSASVLQALSMSGPGSMSGPVPCLSSSASVLQTTSAMAPDVDIKAIVAQLFALLPPKGGRAGPPPSCLLYSFSVALTLIADGAADPESVPFHDDRLAEVRALWLQFSKAFGVLQSHNDRPAIRVTYQELAMDFTRVGRLLQPVLGVGAKRLV